MKDNHFVILITLVTIVGIILIALTLNNAMFARRVSTDIELRLINLEELHAVNSANGKIHLEHVDVPTSCSTQYTNMPMSDWTKYEHILGR